MGREHRRVWVVASAVVAALALTAAGTGIATATPVRTQATGSTERLVGSVPFSKGQVGLDAAGQAAVDAMLPELAQAQSIRLDGYVQRAKSPKPQPTGLSRKRAEAVQKYLDRQLTKRGLAITTTVRGMGQPKTAPGSPEARRVEVWITG